jgi:uncharacterized protein
MPRAVNRIFPVAALVFALYSIAFAADTPTPPAGHRVVDESKVLSAAEVNQLADKLKHIEDTTGAQFAVLTVPSAGDEGIAPFANRVFVAWGLGHKGVDDGVLIVLATKDRRVRIEVGRGLEGDIPDVIAKRITADTMGPHFKAGRYADGFNAGVDALASHLDVSADSPPPPPEGVGVPSSELGERIGPFLVSTVVFALAALFGFGLPLVTVFLAWKRGWKPGGGSSRESGASSSGGSSSSSSSSSNDASGGGGDSAGGGSDSSY